MAAVLKKRVVAEFSHVLQDEDIPVVSKKLRLVHHAKPDELPFNLSALNSREALQALSKLERSLPLDGKSLLALIHNLFERLSKENDSMLKSKIAHMISQLSKSPMLSASSLVEDIMKILKTEKSHMVITQLLSALLNISRMYCSNTALQRQLFQCAIGLVDDTSHLVRCKCLELIGLVSADRETSTDDHSVSSMSVLSEFSRDSDCRVRAQAFESMVMLHQRGIKLDKAMYEQVCNALVDDHEVVRLTALKLVWIFSLLYPEQVVKMSHSDESLRLLDDGFSKICNMVNDSSIRVRTEAASLLGSLHNVSPQFLEQTLDKKLMSNMRLKRSSHERQKEYFESGEWATGQKWADDAPREDVDPDSINLICNGACGAFVHGLEDEFLEVRNAAVDSLCELASRSPTFAKLSQDFLVDMFNDEIEAVRVNAINSLRKICHHLLLREDQLEIILSVLKDFNFEVRVALHEMLCCCRVSTKECLSLLVLTLLDNLKRYPEDRQSIWKCMMNLGKQHQSLVLALAPDLLSSHPYFESLEPDVDDSAYVSILILVFNSAVNSPTIVPLFPMHINSHYTYLRNTLPDLVPQLQGLKLPDSSPANVTDMRGVFCYGSFLIQTLQRIQDLSTLDHDVAVQIMRSGIRDLHQVEQVEPHSAASARCVALYLHCQLVLHKAQSCTRQLHTSFKFQHESVQQKVLIQKGEELLLQMENQYLGIGDVERAQMCLLRLRVLALKTLIKLQNDKSVSESDKRNACSALLRNLDDVKRSFVTAEVQSDQFVGALMDALPNFPAYDLAMFQNKLISFTSRNVFNVLTLKNQLQMITASITEPALNCELTLKFTAGLALSVGLVAVIDNVRHIDRLRIQIKYPDQQSHLMLPPISDFKQLSSLNYRLATKVVLSHVMWTEPCRVQLSVVLLCPANKDQTDLPFVELCSPVSVTIAPVPVKR